jgi:hypothetical protein
LYASPGVPPSATIVVPGSSANAVRLILGGAKIDLGRSEDECARGCLHPLALELERRAASLDEVELLLQVVFL